MIQVGDHLPDGLLYRIDHDSRILQTLSIRALFAHKRVLLLGVTGAYTANRSSEHVPAFIAKAPLFHSKGVTHIYCLSANDAFVVYNWSKTFVDHQRIVFLADGSATYARALGVDVDLSEMDMGVRGRQYVLYVDNLVVRKAIIDEPGETADDILSLFI